jgi:hypothetical protein
MQEIPHSPIRSFGSVSEPNVRRVCAAVYITHHRYLLLLLIHIALVNAHSVDSDGDTAKLLSQML